MASFGKSRLLQTAALSVLLATAAGAASAQTSSAGAPKPTTSSAASAPVTALNEVVVTGTTGQQQILETSYAVTAIDQVKLAASPALGLAALLTSVPGLWGEANGGEVNINVSPRGLRGGFLEYISLQEDGLPVMYNGFLAEYEVRKDLTYGRLEATRGGPSGVLTSNGAAAIVNFLSRTSPTAAEGQVGLSYSDYGSARGDFYFGGPIGSSGLSGTIGGYYRRGDGIKDVGFVGDHGGQIRASLTKTFEGGSATVSFKHIDDHTNFFTPQPVALFANGKAGTIPGFDGGQDYLAGPQTRLLIGKSPRGGGEVFDLAKGQAGKTDQVTVRFDYDLGGGFRINDSARLAHINQISLDLRGLGNSSIYPASTFLASDPRVAGLVSAFAGQGAVRAVLVRANDGSVISNPTTMNGNGLLVEQVNNKFSQKIDQFINKLEITHEDSRNTATVGLLTWNLDMDVRQIANTFLLDVKDNANLIDVAAVNGAGQVVGHLTDRGVLQYGTAGSYGNGTVGIRSNSLYFNDEFHVTDKLHIDAGVRHEWVRYTSSAEDQLSSPILAGAFDSTGRDVDNVLANNRGGSFGAGTFTHGRTSFHDTAWTIGGNYALASHLAVYARYSDAFDTGIANFGPFCAGAPAACLPSKTTKLKFAEFGIRYSAPGLYASATGFRSTNKNVAVLVGTAGDSVPVDNRATGVEFDSQWRPLEALTLEFSGVVQKSELKSVGVTGGANFDGNQLDRLPNVQLRFTPTVHFLEDRGQAYVTAAYYGKRYGDLANTLQFDPYTNFDAGVSYKVTERLTVAVQGTNLTNKFALTAGNPRGNSIVAGNNAYGFAHAILPRTLKVSVNATF